MEVCSNALVGSRNIKLTINYRVYHNLNNSFENSLIDSRYLKKGSIQRIHFIFLFFLREYHRSEESLKMSYSAAVPPTDIERNRDFVTPVTPYGTNEKWRRKVLKNIFHGIGPKWWHVIEGREDTRNFFFLFLEKIYKLDDP